MLKKLNEFHLKYYGRPSFTKDVLDVVYLVLIVHVLWNLVVWYYA